MASWDFRFISYDDSVDTPNVVVDGSPNDSTAVVLSHWPGLPTPEGCAADTSAEMVFRYRERGADLHDGAHVVTNNHFDQDGLAGVYSMLHPDEALSRRAQLVGLASAGDFAVAPDRDSARLSMAISALADPDRSPFGRLPTEYPEFCAVLYNEALGLLPKWLRDVQLCRALWADEDAELDAGRRAIDSGLVSIDDDAELDLAVVTLPEAGRSKGHRFVGREYTGIHPMALHQATDRTTILLIDPADGRHRLTCRYEGWVQYRSRQIRPRVDLRSLADMLDDRESNGAHSIAVPPSDLTPEMYTDPDGAASSLDPPTLIDAVSGYLRTADPAWDPYTVNDAG